MVYDKAPVALLAVYPDDRVGEVRRALTGLGVRDEFVHVGGDADERRSLRAEQIQETTDGVVAPQVGIALPKEAAKATGLAVPVASIIGGVLGLAFALIPTSGLALGARLFWFGISGAAAGGTIGFIVAAAMAAKDPFDVSAAQRGTTLRVDEVNAAVEACLRRFEPIRLDALDEDGVSLETLETEEDREAGGIVEEVAENVQRESDADPADRHR